MLGLESTVKQRKRTILGMLRLSYCFGYVTVTITVTSKYVSTKLNAILSGISFTAFYFVPLAEERKTIGIIMAIRGWILLDLCWVVFSGWCVPGYYVDYDFLFFFHFGIRL